MAELKVTKEKEIYNTALVDKNIPTITFESKVVDSLADWEEIKVSVSDATANGALKVFREVIKDLEIKQEDG